MRRVLVVQLGRLGDVVSSRGVPAALAAQFPAASVELILRSEFADLFGGVDWIQQAHPYVGHRGLLGALRTLRRVRTFLSPRPDLIVDLTGSPRSRWICALSRAPQRAGFARRWLYNLGPKEPFWRELNYMEAQKRFCRSFGVEPVELPNLPQVAPPTSLVERLASLPPGPLVVIHPGASNPIRLWRGDGFASVSTGLLGSGCRVLLVGGPGEEVELRRLESRTMGKVAVFLPASLGELTGVLGHADVFVGVDSGPLHLASALGTPCVGLFGPNLSSRAAPLGSRNRYLEVEMPCRPCNQVLSECVEPERSCMDRLSAKRVLEQTLCAIQKLPA